MMSDHERTAEENVSTEERKQPKRTMESKERKMLGAYAYNVLKKYTDEEHLLKQDEIVQKIYETYSVKCDRRDISACIRFLIDKLGYDIHEVRGKGVYLGQRTFEESEAVFLIDAILANRDIDGKYASDMAEKIVADYSEERKKRFDYIEDEMRISRSNNRQFFYNIDILTHAIEDEKKVSFDYVSFDEKGRKETHMVVNPYYLTSNSGKYYLLCAKSREEGLTPIHIRYVYNVKMLGEDEIPFEEVKGCGEDFDITVYANENLFMAGINSVDAEILLRDEKDIIYIYEWFGNTVFKNKTPRGTVVTVKINEQALIRFLLQYGDKMELLAPESTRNKVKEIVHRMAERYK